MANTIVFKLAGRDDVWVADLAAGTVKTLMEQAGSESVSASEVASMGADIEFAVVLGSASQAFASHVDF